MRNFENFTWLLVDFVYSVLIICQHIVVAGENIATYRKKKTIIIFELKIKENQQLNEALMMMLVWCVYM